MQKLFLVFIFSIFSSISLYALNIGDKPCDTCNFVITEMSQNKDNCTEYYKYFFKDMKIYKSYEEFGKYYVSKNKYGMYLKRFLPFEKEKYQVNKELVDNNTVIVTYNIIPKTKSIREGKKADIEFYVENSNKDYFELREVNGGTEISACYKLLK